MVEALRPPRGGFLRPFGCAIFIREFLAGHGPEGSPRIDPDVGAPQTDVFSAYKEALRRAIAEDMVAKEEESRIQRGEPPLTIEEADSLLSWYMERTPMKSRGMRYHSFLVYFGMFKQLGWVEEGREEASGPQEWYPNFPPRIYYRLTNAGQVATDPELRDPLMVLHPEYEPSKRSAKKPR